MKAQRESNFEWLRLAAMLLIVFHHLAYHRGLAFDPQELSLNRFWSQFLALGGKFAVNLFVMISGYFMVRSLRLSLKKVLGLLGQILFWSWGILLLSALCWPGRITLPLLLRSLAPVTFEGWWFVTCYLVLFLLSPFLNRLLTQLPPRTYRLMLLAMFALWCLPMTFTAQKLAGNELSWFLFVYSLAGYIRLHGFMRLSARRWAGLCALLLGLTYLSALGMDLLGLAVPVFGQFATFFYAMERLPVFLASLCCFMAVKEKPLGVRPRINRLAAGAFGVYLIHDHPLMREFLWKDLWDVQGRLRDPMYPLWSLAAGLCVFAGCLLAEHLRLCTVGKWWMDRAVPRLEAGLTGLWQKGCGAVENLKKRLEA